MNSIISQGSEQPEMECREFICGCADRNTGTGSASESICNNQPLNEACVDERYEYVKKAAAPYVQWLGQQENPQGTGWATGKNYGYDIVEMIKKMREGSET